MPLAKHYQPSEVEPRLQAIWQAQGFYHFSPNSGARVYSIDTPPPTVSGLLHLGHVYSYNHTDFMARYFRMKGFNVFYPMGYDDNGLPTERLVEKRLGITASQVGRTAFIQKCLEVSVQVEKDYESLWRRLGLSIDWRYSYRTIDDLSRRTSQRSFIELYRQGLAYRREAPAIWCPECHTAIAQAELNDLDRQPTTQSVRVHERCDTPVEYIDTRQWFICVLDYRDKLLQAGEQADWHPAYMKARYHAWVENLSWDWCISRQRYFGVPWENVLISGWGLAGEGLGKISKSRGGGPTTPLEMIERYSADAVRYWAASTATGKDAVISEEKIQAGARLVTKLWNVARFSGRFLDGYAPPEQTPDLSPADRWALSRLQGLIQQVSRFFESYDYAAAKNEAENFFWSEMADNYLEMCKLRLYDATSTLHEGARFTLYQLLFTLLKLFAPILPFVTDEIFRALFASGEGSLTIHTSTWPEANPEWIDTQAEELGQTLVEIASCVRRYKSENNLSLGAEINRLQLRAVNPGKIQSLRDARVDVQGVTRARQIEIVEDLAGEPPADGFRMLGKAGDISIYLSVRE